MALVQAGDEVIMPNPSFPIYESMVDFVGARPVFVPLVEEKGFGFDLDVFAASLSDKTRLVILNSPSNPTGGVDWSAAAISTCREARAGICWANCSGSKGVAKRSGGKVAVG